MNRNQVLLVTCLLVICLVSLSVSSPSAGHVSLSEPYIDLDSLAVLHREKRQGRRRGPPGGRRPGRRPPPRGPPGGGNSNPFGIFSNPAVQGFKGGLVGGAVGSVAAPAVLGLFG